MTNLKIRGGVAALLLALTACSDSSEPAGSMEPSLASSTSATLVECPSDQSFQTSGDVLPTGGSVSLRGHSVTVPSGAVLLPTSISLAEPASQYMQVNLGANGEDHFQFRAPIRVTISYARCSRSNLDKAPLSVWLIDEQTGALLQNMGGVDDKVNRTVTFETDHFSGYAIAN